MQIPSHLNQQATIDTIERVAILLSPRFVVPGYGPDDILQEARIAGLEALPRYQADRGPLENFLFVHVKRRLTNLRRDHTRRHDPPCRSCAAGRPCGADGRYCKRFLRWEARQQAKAARNKPLSLAIMTESQEPHTSSADLTEDVATQELLNLIDEHLDVELRATYLQMRAGRAVPRAKRLAVEEAVRDILGQEVA